MEPAVMMLLEEIRQRVVAQSVLLIALFLMLTVALLTLLMKCQKGLYLCGAALYKCLRWKIVERLCCRAICLSGSPYDRPTALLRQHRAVKAAVLP